MEARKVPTFLVLFTCTPRHIQNLGHCLLGWSGQYLKLEVSTTVLADVDRAGNACRYVLHTSNRVLSFARNYGDDEAMDMRDSEVE